MKWSPAADQARGAFVSWLPFHGRSQAFIDALELEPIYASYLRTGNLISAPVKYGPQFLRTIAALRSARPQVIFVMDPPVFAVASVFFYCLGRKARYIMDCHSGVFESGKWRWSLPLQRFFARRAAAVIVTNPWHAAIVRSWGAPCLIMGDPPPASEPSISNTSIGTAEGRYVFVIVRFDPDEAIPETIAAARQLPDVLFKISGDSSRGRAEWVRDCPPNVTLTGFLPLDRFWTTVQEAAIILTLTTRENTLLQGAWEAMFTRKPLVTSDTEALRNYFTRGTIFVGNTPDGIAEGIRQALAHGAELSDAMDSLRREKYELWAEERAQLEQLLDVRFPPRRR
jgi:glycosyltransferase involved in cell wall biosynthesis